MHQSNEPPTVQYEQLAPLHATTTREWRDATNAAGKSTLQSTSTTMVSTATSPVSSPDEEWIVSEASHAADSPKNESLHPVSLATSTLGRYIVSFLLVTVLVATAGVASSRYEYHYASLDRQHLTTEASNSIPRSFGPSGLVVIPDTDEIGRSFQAINLSHNHNWQKRRRTQSTRRDAVSLSQSTFGSDEDLVVNFINVHDRQPGDWIGITAAGAGADGLIEDGEYIAYAYGKDFYHYSPVHRNILLSVHYAFEICS